MPPRSYASQGRRTRVPSSNRDQENLPLMLFSSIIYGRQEAKRWDTTERSNRFTFFMLILAIEYQISHGKGLQRTVRTSVSKRCGLRRGLVQDADRTLTSPPGPERWTTRWFDSRGQGGLSLCIWHVLDDIGC